MRKRVIGFSYELTKKGLKFKEIKVKVKDNERIPDYERLEDHFLPENRIKTLEELKAKMFEKPN